jgi:hypothetical protein
MLDFSYGQISFSISTEQEFNDNPFKSVLPEKTIISSFDGGLEIDLDAVSFGYYGSYINFDIVPERNFYWHQASAWKSFDNSTLGFYAEQRINKEEYNYFNYTNLNAFYQQKFSIGEFHFSVSPNISLIKYDNISILDNYKLSMGYFVNRGFESGTTLILGGAFNYKKYLDPVQSGVFEYFDSTNTLIKETFTDKNINSLSQLITYGRIAQSITPTTGAAMQFTNRSIINGIGNQYKELNMVYGDESEIFDDPVNNEGNGFLLEITQLIGEDMSLKAGYYFNKKFYPSQGIYDEAGNYSTGIMRADSQSFVNILFKKTFSLNDSSSSVLSLGLNFQYINNKSNSYWFNYNGNMLNISLGVQF